MKYFEALLNLGACSNAITWSQAYDDPQEAWRLCERGDWMIWLIARVKAGEPWSEERRKILCTLFKCLDIDAIYTPDMLCLKRWANGEEIPDIKNNVRCIAAMYAFEVANFSNIGGVALHAAWLISAREDRLRKYADIIRQDWPENPI